MRASETRPALLFSWIGDLGSGLEMKIKNKSSKLKIEMLREKERFCLVIIGLIRHPAVKALQVFQDPVNHVL
jgi:hypothetical protein